jgi:hypothetical protein
MENTVTNYITKQKFTAVTDTTSKDILAGSFSIRRRVQSISDHFFHIHCSKLLSLHIL